MKRFDHAETFVKSHRAAAKRTAWSDVRLLVIDGETVSMAQAMDRTGLDRIRLLRFYKAGHRTWSALTMRAAA